MKMLDFKMGKIYIKHVDMLMNYENYMPNKSVQIRGQAKNKVINSGSINVEISRTDLNNTDTSTHKMTETSARQKIKKEP
jgi:hypothetical protein